MIFSTAITFRGGFVAPPRLKDLLPCKSLELADIVAEVPEGRPGQGNSTIIESEWPVL